MDCHVTGFEYSLDLTRVGIEIIGKSAFVYLYIK